MFGCFCAVIFLALSQTVQNNLLRFNIICHNKIKILMLNFVIFAKSFNFELKIVA
jgi:hypothetical protein